MSVNQADLLTARNQTLQARSVGRGCVTSGPELAMQHVPQADEVEPKADGGCSADRRLSPRHG
jgi:hypothetical protein